MSFNGVLEFKGTWRNYQQRVLNNSNKYLLDGKIHIVAAPGSGKTTLGIEMIRRLNQNALILTPSITIKEQWGARIEEAFLTEQYNKEDIVSLKLKEPKQITVATYQALHSAMKKIKDVKAKDDSELAEEENIEQKANDYEDYSDFDLIKAMNEANVRTLCLDECHHLRSEWWSALEDFKKKYEKLIGRTLQIISLTATPPYDDTPALWERYMSMCGEIDEEITTAELVKENSLCPHQDYVYLNYPTREETKRINEFYEGAQEFCKELLKDAELLSYISTYKGLRGELSDDMLLENPGYFASILIYLNENNIEIPKRFLKLLCVKELPKMNSLRMEWLLQGFLYDDTENFEAGEEYLEKLRNKLKVRGYVNRRKITMSKNLKFNKELITSVAKCDSIKEIVSHEYSNLGDGLRLLILTDYIKKEFESIVGDDETKCRALGVIPIFEMLRRDIDNTSKGLKLGVLCGSVVIIPSIVKDYLEKEISGIGQVTYSKIGKLSETEYIKVNAVSDSHFLTAAITKLFSDGHIQVMVGTKSLLGEGWDAPCVNSMIMASFVGSFMLSNQMRGRAIRVWKEDANKTSNIWHLVSVYPQKDQFSGELTYGEDYDNFAKKMDNFLGLNYTENTIESGISRITNLNTTLDSASKINRINKATLEMSNKRSELRKRWMESLELYNKMEITNQSIVEDKLVSKVAFFDAIRSVFIAVIYSSFASNLQQALLTSKNNMDLLSLLISISIVFGFVTILTKFPKIVMLGSPMLRLKAYGNGILKALIKEKLIEEQGCKVEIENEDTLEQVIYLKGGTSKDKALFATCIKEFFNPIDNQRYILAKKNSVVKLNSCYAVPEVFAKKKELAESFSKCMKSCMGKYELIYTRNPEGREKLLKGRVWAYANRQQIILNRQKLKITDI